MKLNIGAFLHEKAKSRGLQDTDVAKFINISPKTLRKVYLNDDVYVSRLIELSKLFKEDLLLGFYYKQEPLKGFKEKELKPFKQKIAALEEDNAKYKKQVEQLEDHINTQKQLIETQESQIKLLQQKKK